METDDVLTLLKDVAEEVVNPRFRSLDREDIAEKNPGDLVTVADRESEERITAVLQSAYPDALVLGEEATAADAALMDRFRSAEHAFTVDPVDGTKNFVHGSPDHAMMIAEVKGGDVVRGWIWQPQHEVAYIRPELVVSKGEGHFVARIQAGENGMRAFDQALHSGRIRGSIRQGDRMPDGGNIRLIGRLVWLRLDPDLDLAIVLQHLVHRVE